MHVFGLFRADFVQGHFCCCGDLASYFYKLDTLLCQQQLLKRPNIFLWITFSNLIKDYWLYIGGLNSRISFCSLISVFVPVSDCIDYYCTIVCFMIQNCDFSSFWKIVLSLYVLLTYQVSYCIIFLKHFYKNVLGIFQWNLIESMYCFQ